MRPFINDPDKFAGRARNRADAAIDERKNKLFLQVDDREKS